ncbi:MAG: carcinine hydrolase/isopenicillin-N N-acyltransferase family protein [Lachnospiraceae bacterium]|nr:carcinine hydrolase/isopenicillin-N N-acyltransferase family protein [Lachnospiraceae bacterium]
MNNTKKNTKVDVVLDHVIDAGTYDSLDFEMANAKSAQKYDFWVGGCTVAATQSEAGDTIVGRNLDLYISDKPAYVCRTAVPGEYKTVGAGYTNMSGGSFEEVAAHGMPEDMHAMLPYLCTDILNEKGLFCEINMRNGEFYPDGTDKFGCPGTNPDADIRACVTLIPRLVSQHCATVKEAVEYLKTIDLYTPKKKGLEWNFCFIMADATGDYGLVEIAENKISFLDKQQAQTNFYVTEEFAEKQEYKCGLGRYETIMNGIDDVKNEKDMFNLINKTTYFQTYFPDRCQFDWRTENVGVKPNWNTEYVLDEAHRNEVKAAVEADGAAINSMTRQELEAVNKYWETILTIVANCNNKTMTIRFFEDDNRVLELGL